MRTRKNLTGLQLGKLTVISSEDRIGRYPASLCRCDCGNTKILRDDSILSKNARSCGCLLVKFSTLEDLTGKQYGKYTVIRRFIEDSKYVKWLCRCECGLEKPIKRSTIIRGKAIGCPDCATPRHFSKWKGSGELGKTYWSQLQRGAASRDCKP